MATPDVGTNFQYFKRSTRKPTAGDVFTMRLPDGRHLFGRVIRTAIPSGEAPIPQANLIYIYSPTSTEPHIDLSRLTPENLLIPPTYTNAQGWLKGVYLTIARQPLEQAGLLTQHCFRDYQGKFRDIDGSVLTRESHPCGSWGLASFRGIDDEVSDAIGIPRAPMDEEAERRRR